MNNDINSPQNPNRGKAMAGIILLVVGAILLLKQFSLFFLPESLELWPLWLVAWGLYVGAKHNFQKSSGPMLIAIGVVLFIINNIHDSDRIVWPIAIIAFGMWLIVRRGKSHDPVTGKYKTKWEKDYADPANWGKRTEKPKFDFGKMEDPIVDYTVKDGGEIPSSGEPAAADANIPPQDTPPFGHHNGDDYLDTVSIFGGVNKTILSKNFKGGDIVNIFGGAELDFTQADIDGRVYLDITQIFGGTKIIVPSNWQVVSDLAAVFASVDDKRIRSTASNVNGKILVLKGVSIFAGVDIRSY
ncbi:LiaF domain-containing protein [Mucilaginibacter sp. OK283]|uniref:LiaF transmembrane domain-containing protein n=1 Tax=Mucilaginibacter sp. OK283 TaxID=1881049 RepID=UPI0008C21A89|nr:LiaF domain-containing protein [Mucilaginibacter sp. OK283]SEO59522.1 Cell wall-active antibiotics response 4TMS YvqF [Mucilaginibacter sp. OK283]